MNPEKADSLSPELQARWHDDSGTRWAGAGANALVNAARTQRFDCAQQRLQLHAAVPHWIKQLRIDPR
jgi:hypothetical protein